MSNNRLSTFLFSLLVSLSLVGCGLKEFTSGDVSDHKSEYIIPLFKSQLTVESVSKLANLSNDRDISSTDLLNAGLLQSGSSIPRITKGNNLVIGPLPMTDDSNSFIRAKSDTAIVRAIFKNNFPITVGKGTRITFRNNPALSGGDNDTIFSDTLLRDIPANGIDSVDIERTGLFGWIYNDYTLEISNFNTPGNPNVAFPFPGNPTAQVFLKIIVLKLNVAELSQDKKYVLSETSPLDLTDADDVVNLDSAGFVLFIKNRFPADYLIQASMLDADKNEIGALFDGEGVRITPPSIDWTTTGVEGNLGGSIVPTSVVERRFTATWSRSKFELIKQKCKFLKTYAYLKTPTEFTSGPTSKPLFLTHDDKIDIQMTAGFKVKFGSN